MFLPGESQGQGSLVGCHLWGRTESNMTEATMQQQQCGTGARGGSLVSFLGLCVWVSWVGAFSVILPFPAKLCLVSLDLGQESFLPSPTGERLLMVLAWAPEPWTISCFSPSGGIVFFYTSLCPSGSSPGPWEGQHLLLLC